MKTLLLLASATLVAGVGLYGQMTSASLKPEASLSEVQSFVSNRNQALALIDQKKYAEAIVIAEALTKASPDDLESFYVLAKANRLAGHIDQAEKATQWMLDLRPENPLGVWEAALLRESYKDLEGAIDFLNLVYRATPASKTKERREILTDLARVFEAKGLKEDAKIVHKEMDRLKGMETDAKSTAAVPHP